MTKHTIYKRTRKGLVAQIISDQRKNSTRRGHMPPEYSLEELRKWIKDREELFEKLFMNWVDSDFDRWKRPSINRLDNNKSYSLSNIELMTAYDNLKLEKINPKPVRRSDGKEYKTILEAEKENNYPQGKSKISLVCKGKRKSYKGYGWTFINQGDLPL